MGLIGNITILSKNPLKFMGGATLSGDPSNFNQSGMVAGRFARFDQKGAIPYGYTHGAAWFIARKSGGSSAYVGVNGNGILTGNAAMGLNAETLLVGSGDIVSAIAGLIVSAIATISGSGELTAVSNALLQSSATLLGSGDITGSISALANAVSNITGSGTVQGGSYAKGFTEATIKSFGDLSPEGLAAAVWNSVAAQFNEIGTMGNKMNSAASAGDPWSTDLPASYTGTQAGAILSEIERLVERLHRIGRLDPANPLTVTPITMDAGDIHIDITGDGETSSTFTATS